MPLPSSGIIVVEKTSSASNTKINNIKKVNCSIYPPHEQIAQQTHIQYYEYYDVNENQLSQQQLQNHQEQQHSKIVVDGTVYQQQYQQQEQQQLQIGGLGGVSIGRKNHNSSSTSSSSSSTSSSSSSTSLNKPNLHIQTLKTVPMPQTKQYSQQQQQIIQHTTSHTTTVTAATSNPPSHHLHQQSQHVQQINLAASSAHHQAQQQQQHHLHTQQQHMIQVSEEFLEQAANNRNSGNIMISTTGEVINQQQIFKIVSTDATTGSMIIDTTNQNAANTTPTTSKVLLSNLTVLSKHQPQGQILSGNHQQTQSAGQTINFVNAKNLYTTSSIGGGKQQKFTVSTTNVGNYKGSTIKQTTSSAANNTTQYLQQSNALGQQKINMTAGNRNMQMLTTRVQTATGNNNTSNPNNSSNISVISNNAAAAQTMVLQQQTQKFVTNNMVGTGAKTTTATGLGSASGSGNIIKKSMTGMLRTNNSNNSATAVATTKLMNNLQTPQSVKTFITQTSGVQQQQQQSQQNINQITLQQHHHSTKSGKSKFVKQYNNTILNSSCAVAIATLPHQPSNSQNNLPISQQQQQQLQPQTTYINHHKTINNSCGSTKINKINSKYAQSTNVAAHQLPPGTQLHQKSINQTQQQQQFQTSSSSSNIKFVNAQGTIIQQQQSLTPQKINNKQHHHQQQQQQQQYQNFQNFDSVDGNHTYQTTSNAANANITSPSSSGTTTGTSSSSLLTDDIMMVNGTQMTDELSARILQSMSQKSFSNQRYQQQQQHVFQTKSSSAVATVSSTASSPSLTCTNNNNSNNHNMLPPPPSSPQNTIIQTGNNNSSNILLSPREYALYPATAGASTVGLVGPQQQQQHQSSPNHHYNNSITPIATASSNITAVGSFSSNNYITVSTNSNNVTTITPHSTASSTNSASMSNNNCNGATVRQGQSTPNSRSQSMERKLHESSMSRKSTEYYKVNNHNSLRNSHHSSSASSAAVTQSGGNLGISSGNLTGSASNLGGVGSTTPTSPLPLPMTRPPSIPAAALIMEPQAQVIHLQATKTLPGANNSSNDDDDNVIGEEIRPAPVETENIPLRILHSVLLDHNYVNPIPLELPTSFTIPASTPSNATATSTLTSSTGHSQQWSLGGIGAVTAASGSVGMAVQQNYNLYGAQLSRVQQDDDSYSAINNNSRLVVGDIDPGEETETAPEAELEDDSYTRCICDYIHDDGYMICCDKCCAWQHVDCMGIDRQNIPDEYLCEICQPRSVDKARARSLQLMKRKEQQQQLMLTAQTQAVSAGTMGTVGSANGGAMGGVTNLLPNDVLGAQQRLSGSVGSGNSITGNMTPDSAGLQLLASGGSNLKKGGKMLKKVKDGATGKRSKKAEKLAAAAASGLTASGKPARKETKKSTKRKKGGTHDGVGSTVGMSAAEKHAANLRQWIENYELAVTNHYSPELRARLHAISKQSSLLQSILNSENPILKEFSNGSLENRATTVPHAGGKILISNLDIIPNSPICELRGKYMLTTQYKTQNSSMNMNSPPPNNYHLASYKAHKTPGPFIFFYQLPGTQLPTSNQLMPPQTTVTATLNPDGTYTTTTVQAQQSPPNLLKGPEICVDTRTYGNEARFVRRSCRPNAEIQHLFEKGTIHLFIVALTDIRASTEITIRHEPHDLLAVENKKSSSVIIQPTSTSCACGLTKDCIFGPPLPQLPPASKSNVGRKSLTHSGSGVSSNTGNLTAKQRKTNQQNLNRNRSISSSASGDSNMGSTASTTTKTVAMGLNSPNNMGKMGPVNKMINNNTLMPLTASCNSNLSNASSTSSTLTSIVHDSGICTSSSSPSVSIPSPTHHMHSPIQHQQQQQHQQQLLHNNQIRSTVQLLPQQQQQQLMQSLPIPLMLSSPDMVHQQQQQHHPSVLQQPAIIIQQQQKQPLSVIAQEATTTSTLNTNQDVQRPTELQYAHSSLAISTQTPTVQQTPQPPSQTQTQLQKLQQRITLHEQKQRQTNQVQTSHHSTTIVATASSTGLLETVSPDDTIAAVALQSLNTSQSPNLSTPSPSPSCANVETTQLQSQLVQQQEFVQTPPIEVPEEHQHEQQQQFQSSDNLITGTSLLSSATSSQQQQQQNKSPQKNNISHHNSSELGRKTPGKHARTTSFSEDNKHHANEDHGQTSTSKEKPKLSREDRKMEAILKAIEKMERTEQKKQEQEQKQAKRQNAGSHNTTPTSPNKSFESGENCGGTKCTNNYAGSTGKSKKKRKAGAKGGQGGGYNNQRKRRQSRMNSQESVDECSPHDQEAFTSESDGGAAMHSPPIQTMTSLRHITTNFSTPTTTNGAQCTTSLPNETITNNVDQAAGLLMAFANPNISSTINSPEVTTSVEQKMQESPQRSTAQYSITSNEMAACSPPTPPSQVSSACLLIEAAVGPLESNLDNNSTEIHTTEFKYPLQAKIKKHLINNWLHQEEEQTTENNVTNSTPQASVTNISTVVSGGLDSLLQAAMSDLKQSQNEDVEQPQNLSIVAQKVEEFIQQTEAPQTKHSYEYEQHHQQQHHHSQISYVNMPTPAVDLTLKTPLTIGPNPISTSEITGSNRNFNMPLQVSTCSNNSSVKKRWLRQAISEETHEEFQNNFSITPSPTTIAVVNNTFVNSQFQPAAVVTCSSAAITTHHVPNGFSTPLKKRRLLLAGKDDLEENLGQSCVDLSVNSIPSSPTAINTQLLQQHEVQYSPIKHNPAGLAEFENKIQLQSSHDIHEDVDVDVEKCEMNEVHVHQSQEEQFPQNLQYSKLEIDQEQDVDVTSPQDDDTPILDEQIKVETVIKHENDVPHVTVVKEESALTAAQQTEQTCSAEFNDQEDDVDILRSPSPGQELIKAEDNLVKIEPEDTSGTEDVKIDVEREEESMAADDDFLTQHAVKEDLKIISSENKKFIQEIVKSKLTDEGVNKVEQNIEEITTKTDSAVKTEGEIYAEVDEPQPKRLKLEKSDVDEKKLICVKKEPIKTITSQTEEVTVKHEVRGKIEKQKHEIVSYSTTKEDVNILKAEPTKIEKHSESSDIAEVSSSTSSTVSTVRSVGVDTTFANLDAATPPPPPPTTNIINASGAPIQRQKSLSDDDIQARLHSFHKENILILQSRNKKSKSSSSISANTNCITSNIDHHKNRTSSSSSSSSSNHQYTQHNHHHHHHEGKEKSEHKSKHHKSTPATGSVTSKKQKLHKRERTTSSSSSNSHKNSSSTPQISSSSSSTILKKAAVINSIKNTSGSSKKLKSLKKSASGSSTSSSTSSSSHSLSTLALQNCYSSNSFTTATSQNLNSEKEKHQRQRTSSSSSGNINIASSNMHATPTSKKRKLNFELELTKDLLLANCIAPGSGKHKRETSKVASEEQCHVSSKKAKKETPFPKEELKNGTTKQLGKIEKQHDKKFSTLNTANNSMKPVAATNSPSVNTTSTKASSIPIPPISTPTEEPKLIPTIISEPPPPSSQPPLLPPAAILREHPTLPHFNNVVIASNSPLGNQTQQPPLPPVQSQPQSTVLPQNIPNHINSPSFIPSVHSNHQHQQQQHSPLPSTPASNGVVSSPLSTANVNITNQLPFYNTIYGKLLDNPTPQPPLNLPTALTTIPTLATTVSTGAGGVLSEYLDTKLKSYNTLGGYVSHTALFGLNNAAVIKDSSSNVSTVSSSIIVTNSSTAVAATAKASSKEASNMEMPAPLPPPPTVSGSITILASSGSSSSAATTTPLKIHTKTASHDPRLNPQLTAPEPPPQPKRKLSINEYRKRMQQSSSSNDSNSGSGQSTTTTTPTTPPTPLDTALLLTSSTSSATTLPSLTNKCTLNSPDRLTQSVDSQIQKEIMSSTTAVTSSSLDPLNSSNSSTSSNSLNDILLRSSSFVEEDSTKGQFNAAPTLLEKQQESLCARLKSLKEKQSLGTSFGVGSRSRYSSFSESAASSDFGLRKDEDELDIIRNRNHSISSSIGGGDLLDNCLEEISSTSTSMSSSREPSPERCYATHHKILTASATTTMTNTSGSSHNNNGQTTNTSRHNHNHHSHHHQLHQQQQHHTTNCDKGEMTGIERKKSVDIA